jgi:hypothetical protein
MKPHISGNEIVLSCSSSTDVKKRDMNRNLLACAGQSKGFGKRDGDKRNVSGTFNFSSKYGV